MAISITKPTVGGSEDTWGTLTNDALDTIVDAVNGTTGTIAPDLSTLTMNGTDVTATAAELNTLDGVTSSTAEINLLDGSVAETVVNNKAVIYGNAGEVAATTVSLGTNGWTITASGTTLEFRYNGTVRFKMTSTGTFQADDDIQAVAF